ncbi:TetR/AcrR family transcriptional regulator [Ekhidna sp.]
MKTRDKILNAAKLLFNEGGVENVTTRHIASHLKISQGNLHYHFPNKNELIEYLYEDFKKGLASLAGYQSGAFGLQEIYASLRRNFGWMYDYKFLFVDREIVWRRIPIIKRETQALIIIKSRQLKEAIRVLQLNNVFRSDINDNQIQSFINAYQIMINSWLSAAYLFPNANVIDFFSLEAFNLWYPYLTEVGQSEFDRLKSGVISH